ncbi:MAG: aminotransferase class V-fold PLP-dependent enzyme [Bryobacteraceae bacterium]
MTNRREVLQRAALGAALFGLTRIPASAAVPALPDPGLRARNPERYWKRIREEQFLLPGWRAYLNNGSLGVATRPVLSAVTGFLERSASLQMDDYPRWGYETLDEIRAEVAEFAGCSARELALTHNATEGMSFIANGLDLKAGDEVVITDQEHPSGRNPWLLKQARAGVSVREVKLPIPPKSPEELADAVVSSLTGRTRVLSFSGILSHMGLILPVREICAAARAKGVITVVDGAHMHGQMDCRIADFGCDFFVGSPHKWMFAPAGCGLLYVREELIERLWPTVVTGGWDKLEMGAARYMMVGTNNRAIFEGLLAGVRFLKQLGPENVYSRIHELARMARSRCAELPGVEMLTPDDDRLYAGLVTMRFRQENMSPLWESCQKKRIWTMKANPLRISTHIHTRPSDIELFVETAAAALGG